MGRVGGGLVSMVVAFGVGLAVGLLTAPRPGRETRQILRERCQSLCEDACQTIEERISDFVESVESYTEGLQEE
ncbi:hypothetical protein HKBW3S06_01343 [Candidatus Hakubella thermalkaliphila]|uniref:YtxH domain-containing protein n=1 Tax=Candidatus Hakubella thermalkaliphila TaxID=2754717 RepID=A0A6V8P4B0_9ACTN|nr:YtxH domain-containing protein [Candidatus Hakubella thermalkaliphila]MBT9171493.1 hypothetical protein [Actinomycetota bacterium]GFP22116.1 hypothetical protein HKBW3S06_01343 [Candidatus Hakubella thermalkaliphila]GFP27123.1 hypothetical protein HKBW3S33_00535 [Candidatus Hakubella thermalkaliphila]